MKEIQPEQVKLLSDLLETWYVTILWCLSSKKKAGTFWFFSRWSSKLNKVGVHTFLPSTGLFSELTLGSLSVVWVILLSCDFCQVITCCLTLARSLLYPHRGIQFALLQVMSTSRLFCIASWCHVSLSLITRFTLIRPQQLCADFLDFFPLSFGLTELMLLVDNYQTSHCSHWNHKGTKRQL